MYGSTSRFDHRLLLESGGDFGWAYGRDLVTYATVELLSREIYDLGMEGAVAEVGVCQGRFATMLNHHFPDRSLHLFDTFEGFDSRDLSVERDLGYGVPYPLPEVTPDEVLSRLPHAEQVKLHVGWFPDTATDCKDERFCFVNIDVGLYQPTYAALEWFYPRMVHGGFLSVTDYNNDHAKGVKIAVRQFVHETRCAYTVLPDYGARALLVKVDRAAR
jgi:O-methyltransferase